MLKRIFASKRDKATGGWRKLHNVELCNSCFPLNTMIKSRKKNV
jgi:hypothetical protein